MKMNRNFYWGALAALLVLFLTYCMAGTEPETPTETPAAAQEAQPAPKAAPRPSLDLKAADGTEITIPWVVIYRTVYVTTLTDKDGAIAPGKIGVVALTGERVDPKTDELDPTATLYYPVDYAEFQRAAAEQMPGVLVDCGNLLAGMRFLNHARGEENGGTTLWLLGGRYRLSSVVGVETLRARIAEAREAAK